MLLQHKAELTKKNAIAAVDALFETIPNILSKEEKIQLIGFGTFEVRERVARTVPLNFVVQK